MAIIDNIIAFYGMQADALGVLVANTEKALEESDRERKANHQKELLESFVKDLAVDLDRMLTRFHFREVRNQMTDEQTKALADFTSFVKTLTKNVSSLLTHFQRSQTYEEEVDKEIKQIETDVRQRLKEYDEALSGTSETLKYRLNKYVSNKVTSIKKFLRGKGFGLKETEKAKLDGHQAHRPEHAPIDSIDSCHTQLESFVDILNINTGGSSSKKPERQIHLEV